MTPGDPYPYLEKLQDKMEERLAHRVPAAGRFCGFCFGRLRREDTVCPFCEGSLETAGTANEIPQEVLRAYRAKQRAESSWVYGMGFIGLIIASVLFVVLVIWGPGILGHPAVAFAVLIGGGYVLARYTGEIIGGPIGYRRGVAKRSTLWSEWLRKRETGG